MSKTMYTKQIEVFTYVLKELQKKKFDKVDIYLHDYEGKIYPEYSKAVISWVMKCQVLDGLSTLAFEYAGFADKNITANQAIYKSNSRFVKVPYKSVKIGIEKEISKLIRDANKELIKFERQNKIWLKEVKKLNFGKAVLRIELENNQFVFKKLNPERFLTEGFASALRDIKKGEVSISKPAMELINSLSHQRSHRGFSVVEYGLGGGISIASQSFEVHGIHPNEVSVTLSHYDKLRKLVTVE